MGDFSRSPDLVSILPYLMQQDATRAVPQFTSVPDRHDTISPRRPSYYERTVPLGVRQTLAPVGDMAPEVRALLMHIVRSAMDPANMSPAGGAEAGLGALFRKTAKPMDEGLLMLREGLANEALLQNDAGLAKQMGVFTPTARGVLGDDDWLHAMSRHLHGVLNERRAQLEQAYQELKALPKNQIRATTPAQIAQNAAEANSRLTYRARLSEEIRKISKEIEQLEQGRKR